MTTIFTAYQQSFKEIWQDKRTIWARMILPLLLLVVGLWIISLGLGGDSEPIANDDDSSKINIGLIHYGNGAGLVKQLKLRKDVQWLEQTDAENIEANIEADSFDMAIVIDEYFDDAVEKNRTGEVLIYYNSANEATKQSLEENITWYENRLLRKRLEDLNLSEDLTDPINISGIDTATVENTETDSTLSSIGGVFALLLLFYGWLGGVYPSLTLFTADTLNAKSILDRDKSSVFMGRLLAVVSCGLLYALILFGGLYFVIHSSSFSGIYAGIAQASFDVNNMLWVILSLIPLTILFGSFLSWSVLKYRTFKDTQNSIQPLKVTIFMLLLMGVTDSFGFNFITSIVPVLGVGSISGAFVEGDFPTIHIVLAYISSFGFAYLFWKAGLQLFKDSVKSHDDTFLAM